MAPPQSPKATPPQRSATSRLLAMKFMNRLGPADSTPTAPSPLASSRSTPASQRPSASFPSDDDRQDDERPSAKRLKTSRTSSMHMPSSPSPAVGSTIADMEAAMRASMEEEERRRQAAIKKRAAELGDEHWTWDAPLPPHVAAKMAAASDSSVASSAAAARMPYTVVRVGFAEIDERADVNAAAASSPAGGSTTKPRILRFNMKGTHSGKDDDSSETDDDNRTGGDGKGSRKRPRQEDERKNKNKEKPTKLKHLTSLSSQGGQSVMKCHRCGKPGHKAASCPADQQRRPGGTKRR